MQRSNMLVDVPYGNSKEVWGGDPLVKMPVVKFYLKHEANDEDHGHTGHDIRVVLYDEFMAEYWRILVALRTSRQRHFARFCNQ